MQFSNRTRWDRQPNKLTELLNSLRESGKQILDLTISNPTKCNIQYPENEILAAFSNSSLLSYDPDPHGLLIARKSVCDYYKMKNIVIRPTNVFLTASTSEAYSILFKLLCNSGESILVPKPSYPIFDYLAQLNDIQLKYYSLRYDGEWHVDIDSLKHCITESFKLSKAENIKAIVIVNPHNPTGMFLKKNEYESIKEIAQQYNLALIVDEVFIDYSYDDTERISSTADENEVLTFTLNGISKAMGLPQMKLGWIVISGKSLTLNEVMERLEIICDTFLSVNTPVQTALPKLFEYGKVVQKNILDRVRRNYSILKSLTNKTPCSILTAHGGWYAVIHVPRIITDEEWALQLLENKKIYVHPGYFFDFDEDGYFIVSLLIEKELFVHGIKESLDFIINVCNGNK